MKKLTTDQKASAVAIATALRESPERFPWLVSKDQRITMLAARIAGLRVWVMTSSDYGRDQQWHYRVEHPTLGVVGWIQREVPFVRCWVEEGPTKGWWRQHALYDGELTWFADVCKNPASGWVVPRMWYQTRREVRLGIA